MKRSLLVITRLFTVLLLLVPLSQLPMGLFGPLIPKVAATGSWNSLVPCTPINVKISDITAGATGSTSFNNSPFSPGITTTVSGGVAKRWLTPGPTPSGWHSPGPPCTITNNKGQSQAVFVEIDGIKRAGAVYEDSSSSFDATNGGNSYSGGSKNDHTFNAFDPSIVPSYSSSCTSSSDPTCYGRIHMEIDHDWQAAGYCGSGSACDPAAMDSQTTDGATIMDFQGFVYWDGPACCSAQDHSFSGWELHPLTGWRIHVSTPTPSFTFSPASPTPGQTVTFTGSASGGTPPYTFSWTFGDGATATGATVTHAYSAQGSYAVQLSARDSKSVTGTTSQTITVGSGGTPDFTITSSPSTVSFQSGTTSTTTVQVTSVNNFAGTVTLASSVSPSGLTASLSPTSISLSAGGTGSSTLTLSLSTPATYTVTVTGSSGSLSHSTTVSATVTVQYSAQIASDGAVGPSSIGTGGAEKLLQDSAGKIISVYADSSGRISLSYANGNPLTGTWSAPVKSPAPTSPYLRPAALLLSLNSMQVIAEGGSGAGRITEVPITILRDGQNNITGFTIGTPVVLDSSGTAAYPTAVPAHNGDVLSAWGFKTATTSQVRSLRWDPVTGWKNFAGTTSTPDNVTIDNVNFDWMMPSIIERPDNNNVYLMANRLSSGHTLAFNIATWTGSAWSWGTQNLSYETTPSTGLEDPVTFAWDPLGSVVVASYGITGTQSFGVFTLTAANVKTHLDTPDLPITERDWGTISVHVTTGDYYLFLMNVNTDGGSGTLGYIRHQSGGAWDTAPTVIDSNSNNVGLSLRASGSSPTLDLVYGQGTSAPIGIRFARLSPPNPPNFSVSSNSTSLTTKSGTSTTATVTVASLYGFSGTVSLAVNVSATGLTASLSPTSVTVSSGGTATSTLTISSTTVGTYTVTVVGTSGSLSHSAIVGVIVTDFTVSASPTAVGVNAGTRANSTLTVSPVSGFTGTVTLTTSSPAGLNCTLTPVTITLGLTQTSVLSCIGPSGVYSVSASATSGSLIHTAVVSVTIKDYSVTASPTSVNAPAGSSVTATITVAPLNGFTGTVSLTSTVTPSSGASCSLVPTSITLGTSQTSTLSCTGTAGVYSVTVTGTSGAIVHTTTVTVTVQDFSLNANPTSANSNAGSSATSTITIAPINGFTGTVALSAASSPSTGLTCTLSPTSVTLGASQTSSLSCSGTLGIYTVTVTGTSGALARSATVTLTIKDFTVSANPTTINSTSGTTVTSTITLAPVNGFTGTVSLTSSVSPSGGATCSLSPTSVALGGSQISTLSCTGSAASYTVTISGTSSGITHTATVTITNQDFSISASPTNISANAGSNTTSTITVVSLNGFTGTVNLSSVVSPSGPSCSLSPTSVVLGSSQTSTLTCAGTGGVYSVTVTGLSGAITHSATVTVTIADFSATASPSTVTFPTGTSGSSTVSLTSLNGFQGTLSLSSTILPANGLTANCSPTSLTLNSGGSTTSTCSLSSSTPGTYSLTIAVANGTLVHSTIISVNVSDFSASASPTSQTMLVAPTSGTATISLTSLNSFAGTVTLGVSATPGLTASLGQTSLTLTGAGSSSTNLSYSSASIGNYTVTVVLTSGSLSHTVQVNVRIVDFSISTGSSALTILAGQSGTSTIDLTSLGGFAGTIALAATVSPSGLTATVNPTSVTLTQNGLSSSTLTVTSSTGGVYQITVTGASGGVSHSILIAVDVEDYSITSNPASVAFQSGGSGSSAVALTSLGGFAGNVSLIESVNPSTGLTVSCAPAALPLISGGATSSTCTFTSSAQGTYTVTLTATSGPLIHSTTITVGVGDFTISSSASTLSVQAGSSATTVITVSSLAGFSGTVSLSTTVSVNGLTASLNPSGLTLSPGGSATSTLALSSATPGNYTVTVTGTIGSIVHSVQVTVIVVDFSLTSNSSSIIFDRGTSGTSQLQLSSANGFTGTVTLTATVSPSGPTASLSPASVTLSSGGSGPTILSISSTTGGNYTVTVTATSGAITHSLQITIRVRDFTFSANPTTVSFLSGSNATSTMNLTSVGGFNGTVAIAFPAPPQNTFIASCPSSGLLTPSTPLALTCSFSSNNGGTYSLTLTATSGPLTRTVTLSVNVGDFSISANPSTISSSIGASATSTITVTSVGRFSGTVTLVAAGPINVTVSLSQSSLAIPQGGSFTAILTLSSNTSGNYTVQITGTSGVLSHSSLVTFQVKPKPQYALVTSFTGQVYKLQNGTLTLIGQPVTSALRLISWKPDGSYALIVGDTAVLLKWNGTTLTQISTASVMSAGDDLNAVAWNPSGSFALIGGGSGDLLRYDGSSLTRVTNPSTRQIQGISWNPAGTQALLVGNGGTLLSYQNGVVTILNSGTTNDLYGIAWNPNGQYALASGANGAILKYNGTSTLFNTAGLYPATTIVRFISWNPSGMQALLVGNAGGLVLSYDGSRLTVIPAVTTNGLFDVAWSGNTATIVGNSGTVLTYSSGVLKTVTSGVTTNLRGIAWKPS